MKGMENLILGMDQDYNYFRGREKMEVEEGLWTIELLPSFFLAVFVDTGQNRQYR